MSRTLIRWLATAMAVMALPSIFPAVHVEGFGTALAVGLVLGLLNTILKPVLVFLTLPLTLVTLGFFILVINAGMLWLTSRWVEGFFIDDFSTAFFASLFVSAVSWLMSLGGTTKIRTSRVRWEKPSSPRGPIDLQNREGRWE